MPVVRGSQGALVGVEAVIDKDRASALLATCLGADLLVIATDVPGVALHFQDGEKRAWLSEIALDQAIHILKRTISGAATCNSRSKPPVVT